MMFKAAAPMTASRACCCASSLVSGGSAARPAAVASFAAACPSGDRATFSAASSAVAKQRRLTWLALDAELVDGHAEVACLVVGHTQHQPLRLRLLPRLLARQRRRRCSLLCRRLPPRRSGDTQRRLLGGSEVAQVHVPFAVAHPCLVGLGLAYGVVVHAEVARLVVVHDQRQPLRLRLLLHLLACQRRRRRRRCSLLRRRLPLRGSSEAQRRLLGGDEAAQLHVRATALHPRLVGLLGFAGAEVHAVVSRGVVGHEQRQPHCLRLL
eukprot:scaffold74676_cov58-Phaeocystis_antarctica.AAC.2